MLSLALLGQGKASVANVLRHVVVDGTVATAIAHLGLCCCRRRVAVAGLWWVRRATVHARVCIR